MLLVPLDGEVVVRAVRQILWINLSAALRDLATSLLCFVPLPRDPVQPFGRAGVDEREFLPLQSKEERCDALLLRKIELAPRNRGVGDRFGELPVPLGPGTVVFLGLGAG